jgi:hypothetical protein
MVTASSDLTTFIDDETGLHIAKCECINRVGQGRTKAEAVRSLEAVLTAYLRMQQIKGKLTAMLERAPWQRQETTDVPSR